MCTVGKYLMLFLSTYSETNKNQCGPGDAVITKPPPYLSQHFLLAAMKVNIVLISVICFVLNFCVNAGLMARCQLERPNEVSLEQRYAAVTSSRFCFLFQPHE